MARLVHAASSMGWTFVAGVSLIAFACGSEDDPNDSNRTDVLAGGTSSASGGGSPAGAGDTNTPGTEATTGNGTGTTSTGDLSSAAGIGGTGIGGTSTPGTSSEGTSGPAGSGIGGAGGMASSAGAGGGSSVVGGDGLGADGMGGASGSAGGAGGSDVSGDGAGGAATAAGGAGGDDMPGGMGGAGGAMGGEGETTDADEYNPEFVEFYGEDCDVGEPQGVNTHMLPDLFEFFDGSRMSEKSQWRCRRAELKKAVETYIHGEKPGRPETVSGSVSSGSISVHVEHGGKSIDFSVMVSIPAGATSPAPAIIGLGGGSLDRNILTEEGVATINFNNNSLAAEGSRNGLFTDIYGSTGASAQVGWAWGVSRIIDVLVDERDAGRNDIIDPTAIGVTGCSRLGKGAFTIGAFDERIALGIPHESGTGGVSAFRIVNEGIVGPNGQPSQSLSSAWSEAQGWFGTVFGEHRNNVDAIPVDTHSMVAMYAPRGFLVLDNSRIGELGSIAQHAATAAAAEVYTALGVEKNIAYHGGNANDPHNHCAFYESQREPLRRAIRAHLTRTAEPDGRMEPQPVGTADMSEWIDWDTPTLE